MTKNVLLLLLAILLSSSVFSQDNPLSRFEILIGKWEGTGEGFSNSKSKLEAEYSWN